MCRFVMQKWVYPRVCGGTALVRRTRPPERGLSPRVRGNPLAGLLAAAVLRSIPACAGEPAAGIPDQADRRVYPRVCGGTGSLSTR